MVAEIRPSAEKIAVAGCSPFEVGALEALFRMAGSRRPPGYQVVDDPESAALVLLSANSESDVAKFRQRYGNTRPVILVADSDFGSGYRVLPRPMRLAQVLAQASSMLSARPLEGFASAAHSSSAALEPSRAVAPVNEATPNAVSATPALLDRPASMVTSVAREVPRTAFTQTGVPERLPVRTISPGAARAGICRGVGGDSPRTLVDFSEKATAARSADTTTEPRLLTKPSLPINVKGDEAMSDILDERRDILVVDDSEIALKFMQDQLGSLGFSAVSAKSGKECIMMLSKRDYRCVFLDVMMGGLDGYQTCRVIKQRKYGSGPAPKVIMMTSRSGTIDRVRGTLAGVRRLFG